MTPPPRHWTHLALAEAGAQAALRGDHPAALAHYRDAMRLAVGAGAPEVFFRHYLEATVESLELMGEFSSVVEYCRRVLEHYETHPPVYPVAWLDLASAHQRHGVVLLKVGEREPGRAALESAVATARRAGSELPLAGRLLDWLNRGLTISNARILAEQKRLSYFSVRPDAVRNARSDPPLR